MSDASASSRAIAGLLLTPALALGACSASGGDDGGAPVPQESAGAPTSSGGAAGAGASTPWDGASGAGASTSGAGTGGASGGSGGSSAGGGASFRCFDEGACDTAPPLPGPRRDWRRAESNFIAALGERHRGRDLFLNPGDQVWALAKFTYGPTDKDLRGEDVDVYLARDCGTTWEKLGTARTTDDGDHETVEGVRDTGGWVFFPVPAELGLGEGRHRFHFVVAGDLTTTESFVEIVKPGTPFVVSDVDGTLTTDEFAEFTDLLTGDLPDANDGASELVGTWGARGFRRFYLTARPEWLGQRTREFLRARGFPEGVVHTTLGFTGALGEDAATFKTGELAQLAAKGLVPTFALGNTATSAEAYSNAAVSPLARRLFFQYTDTAFGGRRFESYRDLLDEAASLPDLCPN